jgi:hypothetical protein
MTEVKIEKKDLKVENPPLELTILSEEDGLQSFYFSEEAKKLELKAETKM